MGETSAETKREIDALRYELTELVDELERRGRRTMDVRSQVAEVTDRPAARGALAVGLGMALGGVAYYTLTRAQERRRQKTDLRSRTTNWFAQLRERIPVRVEVVSHELDDAHVTVQRERSMVKRVLWAAMSAGLVTLATVLARQLSRRLWERAMHERPPAKTAA